MIHGLIVKDTEQYMQMYLMSTLMFVAVLPIPLYDTTYMYRHIENGIVLICAIHVSYLFLQNVGIMNSGNPYFPITGADCNPNVTSMTLAIGLPFIIKKFTQNRHTYTLLFLFFMSIYYIILLRCRTAYLGLTCMAILCLYKNRNRLKWINSFCHINIKNLAIFSTLFFSLSFAGYHWKKASADGRLFRWERSCEIIINKPLGIGYGQFERYYNNYQSDYFSKHSEERKKSNLQTASGSAYNDIIEHTVQGGLIGGAFFAFTVLSLLFHSFKYSTVYEQCAIAAIVLMLLVNSVCCSISTWIISISLFALIISKMPEKRVGKNAYVICCVLFAISIVALQNRIRFIYGQKCLSTLKELRNKNSQDAKLLMPYMGTSEAYLCYLAECCDYEENYSKSYQYYREALKYTFSPQLLYLTSISAEKAGKYNQSVELLSKVSNMLPGHMSFKYYLMETYKKHHDLDNAKKVASDIVNKKCKHTGTSDFIKKEAKNLLQTK